MRLYYRGRRLNRLDWRGRLWRGAAKSEGRKPKTEGRPKSEIRSGRDPVNWWVKTGCSGLGDRVLGFLWSSGFGYRSWRGAHQFQRPGMLPAPQLGRQIGRD